MEALAFTVIVVSMMAVVHMRAQRRADAIAAAPPLLALPPGPDSTDARIEALLRRFDGLQSFTEVARWDSAATELACELAQQRDALWAYVTAADNAMRTAPRTAWASVEKTRATVATATAEFHRLAAIASDLGERVEMTPDDKAEQRALLAELRAEKKALQAEKREAKASATAVRVAARTASATAGTVKGIFWDSYDPKLAAAQRRAIRREKEAMLQPHEDQVAAIDRQLAAIERRIGWLSRFSGPAAGDDMR